MPASSWKQKEFKAIVRFFSFAKRYAENCCDLSWEMKDNHDILKRGSREPNLPKKIQEKE